MFQNWIAGMNLPFGICALNTKSGIFALSIERCCLERILYQIKIQLFFYDAMVRHKDKLFHKSFRPFFTPFTLGFWMNQAHEKAWRKGDVLTFIAAEIFPHLLKWAMHFISHFSRFWEFDNLTIEPSDFKWMVTIASSIFALANRRICH